MQIKVSTQEMSHLNHITQEIRAIASLIWPISCFEYIFSKFHFPLFSFMLTLKSLLHPQEELRFQWLTPISNIMGQ